MIFIIIMPNEKTRRLRLSTSLFKWLNCACSHEVSTFIQACKDNKFYLFIEVFWGPFYRTIR